MKNLGIFLIMVGILGFLIAGTASAQGGTSQPVQSIPKVSKTGPVSIPHEIVPLVSLFGVGKAELDLTTHQIIFTDAGENGGMGVLLFLDEVRVKLGFSVVHTEKKVPFETGRIYKLQLAQKGMFTIIYFSEYNGRVTVKRVFE